MALLTMLKTAYALIKQVGTDCHYSVRFAKKLSNLEIRSTSVSASCIKYSLSFPLFTFDDLHFTGTYIKIGMQKC